jgi:predicted RNA-binding protein with PUA-like domain
MLGMNYWLVKTEPDVYSIEDLKRDSYTAWTGVRNYQARNFLTSMKVGERVLIYHSNAKPPGVVGIGVVRSEAQPDETQFDKNGEYYDPKASREKPRWFCPDIEFSEAFSSMVTLDKLREDPALAELLLLQRGSRLSVIPVVERHFKKILKLGNQ